MRLVVTRGTGRAPAFRRAVLVVAALAGFTAAGAACAQLEGITNREAISALKAALDRGARGAVAQLGRKDGFYANPRLRIPLPESLAKAEKFMRRIGLGDRADELELAMNRAAESAVSEAKPVFVAAVKKMTVRDAKDILTGGDTAGTAYFQRTTRATLAAKFLPIVRRATGRVDLARKYNAYAGEGVRWGLVKKENANLDDYVTRKALDGLFFTIGEEEKKIRRDPVGTTSNIIKKVFGALIE